MLLTLLVTVAFAKEPSKLSENEYRDALRKHATELSQSMAGAFGAERALLLRSTLSRCRKQPAFAACKKDSNPISCGAASRCPFDAEGEKKWLQHANEATAKAYAKISREFQHKLSGKRRRFSIGTLNRLVDKFNESITIVSTSLSPAVDAMLRDCGGGPNEEADAKLVECMYQHYDKTIEDSIRRIDQVGPALKAFVEGPLGARIAGYTDAKKKKSE